MEDMKSIKSRRELEFAVFCIENVAAALGKPSSDVYRALSGDGGILHQYIVPSYDVFAGLPHTSLTVPMLTQRANSHDRFRGKFDFSKFHLHSISPFDTLRTEPLDGLITDREPLAMRGRASNRKVRGPCSSKHEKDSGIY